MGFDDEFDNWAARGMARLSSMYNHPSAHVTELPTGRCAICDERFVPGDEQAEMFDPNQLDAPSLLVHAECGLHRGMELA